MFRAWFSGVLLICGALAALPAQATVMTYMNTQELTERATSVVRGTVEQQQVVERGGHLWTDSYVRVLEALKGKVGTGQILVLRQPGGETLTVGERVGGTARFAVGEEVLVFARPVRHYHVPVGMCLGKYGIRRGKDGRVYASRDLARAGLASFDPSGRFTLSPPGAARADQRVLTDLRQQITRAVKRATARGGVR